MILPDLDPEGAEERDHAADRGGREAERAAGERSLGSDDVAGDEADERAEEESDDERSLHGRDRRTARASDRGSSTPALPLVIPPAASLRAEGEPIAEVLPVRAGLEELATLRVPHERRRLATSVR
jgi:hypothetical protein